MPAITIIHPDGRTQTFAAPEGVSLMQAATEAGVRGIVAECGGSAMCATCHVYVAPAWGRQFPGPLGNELEMLECAASERRATSRLSCQIRLGSALDGLVVELPGQQ